MDKVNKNYLWFIIAIVIIGLGIWLFSGKSSTPESSPNMHTPQQVTHSTASTTPPSSMQSNSWSGILQNSNNASKGNLMLITPQHTIYINTSQHFSDLIGKSVVVTYEGNLQNFSLQTIVPAVSK